MKPFLCSRCGSMRFVLSELEDGDVKAKCPICDLKVKFRIVKEDKK